MKTSDLLIALIFSSSAANAVSFDCTKASTFVEQAICNDPLLGKLDDALSENYKHMLASNIGDGGRKDLKATQKRWLSDRDKCTNNNCLNEAYRKRADEVCNYPVISGVHPICKYSDDLAEISQEQPDENPDISIQSNAQTKSLDFNQIANEMHTAYRSYGNGVTAMFTIENKCWDEIKGSTSLMKAEICATYAVIGNVIETAYRRQNGLNPEPTYNPTIMADRAKKKLSETSLTADQQDSALVYPIKNMPSIIMGLANAGMR